MRDHFLLGEVAKVVGRKPHQIVHLLTTGKIREPKARIANGEIFAWASDRGHALILAGLLEAASSG
jgi:hypothetical protein